MAFLKAQFSFGIVTGGTEIMFLLQAQMMADERYDILKNKNSKSDINLL